MFLNYKVTECRDCKWGNLLSKLDKAIGQHSSKLYRKHVYLENGNCAPCKLQTLIFYKQILLNIQMNPEYYSYKHNDIISKIKTLV